MWTSACLLVALSINAGVATDSCSKHPDVPGMLAKMSDCYVDGKPPTHIVNYGVEYTVLYMSSGILPDGTQCVKGYQKPGVDPVDLLTKNGSQVHIPYKFSIDGNRLVETDPSNIVYSVWPIYSQDFVYFYFRCIETKGVAGSGQPQMTLYVVCGHEADAKVQDGIARFLSCAKQLQVTNLVQYSPCKC